MVLSVVSLVVTFSLELNLRITAPAQVLCDFTYGLISCYSSTLLTAVSSDAMAPLHLNLKNKNRCARQISLTMMSDMKTHQSWNKMYMCDAKINKLLLVASNDRKKTSAMKMGSVGIVVVRLASSRAVSICPQAPSPRITLQL